MTVLTVVMAITLLLAIGLLSIRGASMAGQAVGYARQSAQTLAVSELGTSAAIAEFGSNKAAAYVAQMVNQPEKCFSNAAYVDTAPCARLFRGDLQASTQAYSSTDLFTAQNKATGEPGSFGMGSSMMGDVYVEVTERGPTGRPVAGTDLGGTSPALQFAKVTMTTTAQVRPLPPTGTSVDTCDEGVAAVASKKVMRARVVVGPI